MIHLGERDCSIQRNHQKVIEEAPCRAISDKLRKKMGEAAVKAAKAAHYVNAGTIEFLLEKNEQFYFMEMNTRIQVEHPVTEWVTGLDLIKEQIRIASGEALSVSQKDIRISGHAIECRINAENPDKNFRPSPGRIESLYLPGGCGVRMDTAVYSGYTIPPLLRFHDRQAHRPRQRPEGGHCQDDQRPGGSDRGGHRHQRGLSLPDPERAGLSGGTDGY